MRSDQVRGLGTEDATRLRARFVSAEDLHDEISSGKDLTILDVRFILDQGPRPGEYLEAHVPGAIFVDMEGELCGPRNPEVGHYPIPGAEQFATGARSWGLHGYSDVVVYAGYTGISAGRLAWLLDWFGHTRVRVLDGGLRNWVKLGLPLEAGTSAARAGGTFAPVTGSIPRATLADVQELGSSGQLLDVRSRSLYRLQTPDPERHNRRPGRIPGAVNVPSTSFHRRNGLLRSGEEVRGLLTEVGIDAQLPVAVYCGGGVASAWSSYLLRSLGIDARLFTASWSEYAMNPQLPVEVEAQLPRAGTSRM